MNLSPELQLLIAAARVELRPQDESEIGNLLSAALDWDRLLTLAAGHGLEPLLFHHLSEQPAALVPEKVMQTLRAGSRETAQRGMILASRLQGISDHLDARTIEHILYKGPLFAEVYYGNCALRVFHDLDVIVPPEKIVLTRNALAEIGFVDKYGLDETQQAASFRFGSQHLFTAPGGTRSGPSLAHHSKFDFPFAGHSGDMEARHEGGLLRARSAHSLSGRHDGGALPSRGPT